MEEFRSDLEKYQYPFENVVFEGGRNKLLPFCGAVKALDESGVWKQIKRLGGSGTGSVVASLLAAGFTWKQLEDFFKDDLQGVVRDGKCGSCSLCCASSGFNPGKAVLKWLGEKFKESSGKSDITFAEIQKRFNKELFVVVTNLTSGCLEYHHVKTTPDRRVIDSVRMSLAVPMLVQSVKNADASLRMEEVFLEGGVLCNYPVYAYDGWWLSMHPDHSFLKKLPQASSSTRDRFSTNFNNKTIGFITFDDTKSSELPLKLQDQLAGTDQPTKHQDSKLFKNIVSMASAREKLVARYSEYTSLAAQFIKFLDEHKKSKQDNFTREDMRAIFTKNQHSDDELNILFRASQVDDIFRGLTPKGKKEVSVQDVHDYLERGRSELHRKIVHSTSSKKISGNADQFEALSDLLHCNNLTTHFLDNSRNEERTIVINTGHIGAAVDGKTLSQQEKQFLVEQGRKATKHFLENHIRKVPLLKEDGEKTSFIKEELKQFIDDDVSEVIDEKDYLESYLERVL